MSSRFGFPIGARAGVALRTEVGDRRLDTREVGPGRPYLNGRTEAA